MNFGLEMSKPCLQYVAISLKKISTIRLHHSLLKNVIASDPSFKSSHRYHPSCCYRNMLICVSDVTENVLICNFVDMYNVFLFLIFDSLKVRCQYSMLHFTWNINMNN